jgi:DNA-binding transcriptional LysR family regulator
MLQRACTICSVKHDMDLNPAALRCLVAVVRQRSVTLAAQHLGMGQPALSHVLARLRKHFGDPLLLRTGAEMTPTPRALQLADAAEDVLAAMDRLQGPAVGAAPPAPTRFVLTCTDYYERLLAPALIGRMREVAPEASLEWRTPDRQAAREWLERGDVDLRLAWVHSPWPGLRFTRLLSDRLVCLVRKGHPAVGTRLEESQFFSLSHVRPVVAIQVMKQGRRPRELSLQEYLGIAGQVPGPRTRWLSARTERLHVPMLAQSFLAIPGVVAATDLIATVPTLALEGAPLHPGVRVLQPPLDFPALHGALYWHERTNADPRHRWFRRLVASVVQGLGPARTVTSPT